MARVRSLLFVPGDSARKQEKALATDADALILDLEDSVDPANLPAARAQVGQLLRSPAAGSGPELGGGGAAEARGPSGYPMASCCPRSPRPARLSKRPPTSRRSRRGAV